MEGALTKHENGTLTGTFSGAAQIAVPTFNVAIPAIRIQTPGGDVTAPAMVLVVSPSSPTATMTFEGTFDAQVELEGKDSIRAVIAGTVESTLRLDGMSEASGSCPESDPATTHSTARPRRPAGR